LTLLLLLPLWPGTAFAAAPAAAASTAACLMVVISGACIARADAFPRSVPLAPDSGLPAANLRRSYRPLWMFRVRSVRGGDSPARWDQQKDL